ncbi:13120_t:CDS:2 [Entrophospora sp. SA101]|nr:13120_t:CDS:2 [Entrophospora sp. SA101]CAJ0875271.1 10263_t:CDS:2 [Entrophospora sp. SA101]
MSSEVKSVAAKGTLAKAKVTAALDIEGNVPLDVAPEKYTIKAGLSPDRMSGFAL